MYGGRLGAILIVIPKVICPCCETKQVQITQYLKGNPEYRCRHCKTSFESTCKHMVAALPDHAPVLTNPLPSKSDSEGESREKESEE